MRWTTESWTSYLQRVYSSWTMRFALIPHGCFNSDCGTWMWLEFARSRMNGGSHDQRIWACSNACADTFKDKA